MAANGERVLLVLIVAVALHASPLAAGAQVRLPWRGPLGSRGVLRPATMTPEAIDPVLLGGPPDPSTFGQVTLATDSEVTRYATARSRFIDSTAALRSSLRATQDSLYEAFALDDQPAVRDHFLQLRELRKRLERRQRAFDDSLVNLVDGVVVKRYQHWRREKRKEAERER